MTIIPFSYCQIPKGFNGLNRINILMTESHANVSEAKQVYKVTKHQIKDMIDAANRNQLPFAWWNWNRGFS